MTMKRKARSRLPRSLIRAIDSISYVQHGLDVVAGHIDASDVYLSASGLGAEHGKVMQTPGAKAYAPAMGTHVKVLQPSQTCIQTLVEDLGVRYTFAINYLEIAADFFVRTSVARKNLRAFLLGHLTIKFVKQRVSHFKGTDYFGSRTTKDGKRRPRVGVIYERRSKLAGPRKGKKCLHLEVRLSGSDAIQSLGVFGLHDLVQFDFRKVWHQFAELRRFSSSAALGREIGGRVEEATSKALHKRTRRFRDDHLLDGAFVLQNAIRANPEVKHALEDIDLGLVFRFGDEGAR